MIQCALTLSGWPGSINRNRCELMVKEFELYEIIFTALINKIKLAFIL